ncbi:hypothetical protein ACI78T_08615 [Blastococcus sp. SYSU D00922]
MTISDSQLEAGLRDLRNRADVMAPPPADLAQRTRERYRAQRRSRAALAAGGLVALVVFVGVPVVASTLADAPRAEVAGTSGRTFVPSAPTGLYALPTRGSLADDEEWLSGVAALAWDPVIPEGYPADLEVPDPPMDTRRVAYAGDVTSGRVALVLGMVDNTVAYSWFTGPAGAAADEMALATFPSTTGPDGVLALRDAPDPSAETVTLVVVAEDGDSVEVRLTPVVEADGTVRSDSLPMDVVDGVAEIDMDVLAYVMSLSGEVRVRDAAGADRPLQMADSDRLGGGEPWGGVPEVQALDPRGLADRTWQQASLWSVGSELATYGLGVETAQPTLLAAGPLGSRVNQYGELYGMTHPSGATSTWLIAYSPGSPDAGATSMQFAPAAAGTALLDRVIAVQAMSGVLVSAPSGVAAQVVDDAGTVLVTVPLERGAGTAPYSGPEIGVTVRILDADGDVLAEAPLEGQ